MADPWTRYRSWVRRLEESTPPRPAAFVASAVFSAAVGVVMLVVSVVLTLSTLGTWLDRLAGALLLLSAVRTYRRSGRDRARLAAPPGPA